MTQLNSNKQKHSLQAKNKSFIGSATGRYRQKSFEILEGEKKIEFIYYLKYMS
jgi:hypothetical protein